MTKPRCSLHKIEMIIFCPACRGGIRSVKKAAAARRNGMLGGHPRHKQPTRQAVKSAPTTKTAKTVRHRHP